MITPKNKEQEAAIKGGIEFIEHGNPDEWLTIVGKAGTGKTTIAQAILEPYIKKKNILVCALSHKAKLVIAEKLIKAYGDDAVVSKSVAGALGMNMDAETGHFILSGSARLDPPIKKAHIILVDEASMINEESHELIMKEKKNKAKVIYLGDIRQLPPIRESNTEFSDKPSPAFYTKNRFVLQERIRQGEESPILPFADFFGDNSRLLHAKPNPAPEDKRKNIVNKNGSLVFAGNTDDVIELVLPLYQFAVENARMDVIKTITYRNDIRRQINSLVRSYLFGPNESRTQFQERDLLMFQDNYSIDGMDEPISNSFEVQINKAIQATDSNYKIWILDFIYDSKPVSMKVLDNSDVPKHAAEVSRLFEIAKKLPFKTVQRFEALNRAWALKNKYAPVDYAYAITSHKAQGSTYNTVVVDERDITSVTMISNKAKSQSMYTALTRASTTCIVLDGQEADFSLELAVEMSKKKLKI